LAGNSDHSKTVHGLEPASALIEFGRKAVVAQVVVEAHRSGAAVAALLLAVVVPVFETEQVEEERLSVRRRIGPDPLVDHGFTRPIPAGILALGAAARELDRIVPMRHLAQDSATHDRHADHPAVVEHIEVSDA
jgi:hypothetical protein